MSIICTIFSHKSNSYHKTVENKTEDKIVEKTYRISNCIRCDHRNKEKINTNIKQKEQTNINKNNESIDKLEDNRNLSKDITRSINNMEEDTGIIIDSDAKNKEDNKWYRYQIECTQCDYANKELKTSRRTGDYCPKCSSKLEVKSKL